MASNKKNTLFQRWLLPGFLFQSVIIGGGYATGRELVGNRFGIAPVYGTITMVIIIGTLVFYGTAIIEKVLAGWSFLLYAVYAVLIWSFLSEFGHKIPVVLATDDMSGPWVMSTIRYVALTATAVTMILFCVRHMECRRDQRANRSCVPRAIDLNAALAATDNSDVDSFLRRCSR